MRVLEKHSGIRPQGGDSVITLKRLALVVAVGMLAFLASSLVSSGQEKSSPENGGEVKKTDIHGDPLPEGARVRMGTLRWRHPANIAFVGFTAQSKQVVTACGDGYFRVWDAGSGKQIRKFGKPGKQADNWWGGGEVMKLPGGGVRSISTATVNTVALSADGKVLAEVGADRRTRLWDVAGAKEIRALGNDPKKTKNDKGISSIALSPDGKTLATRGFDQVIRLYDTGTGKEIRQISMPDLKGLPPVRRFGGNITGNTLAFLADGKSIVAAGIAQERQQVAGVILHIYDVETGKELKQIRASHKRFFRSGGLAVLPTSNTITWANGDGTVGFYDADSGKEIRKVVQPQQNIFLNTMLFSADGKIMATRRYYGPAISLWDVDGGKELRRLGDVEPKLIPALMNVSYAGTGGWANLAFSPDGKTLAEGTVGNTVRLWNVDTGKEIAPRSSGHHGDVNRLAVSPDGKVLTTFASDYTIRKWDMATGKELRQVKVPATAIGLSGDGKLAAWSTGANIKLWDASLGKEIRTIDLPGRRQQLMDFFGLTGAPAISANGKWLAMGGSDQVFHILDTATGKKHRQLVEQDKPALDPNIVDMPSVPGQFPMAFSADGAAFAASSSPVDSTVSSLRLWNLAQWKNPRRFDSQQHSINELAVTPDGRYVVTAYASTICLWEAITGKKCLFIDLDPPKEEPLELPPGGKPLVIEMQPPGPAITALAISPNGRTLAAALDRSVHLIDLRTGKVLGQFKGHNGSVVSIAFAPDNRAVISGSVDTTALVWDGSRLIKKTPFLNLQARQVENLWKDLAGDPVKAYQAIGMLSAAPKQAVALIKVKVKPAVSDNKRIQQLIADLESDKFQVRQSATKELEKLGEVAEHVLRKSMPTLKTLEAKRRVEKLLDHITTDQTPSPEVVRTMRAVQVLGNLGTSEACTELERLAKGAPGDKLTRSAESVLRRLGKNR